MQEVLLKLGQVAVFQAVFDSDCDQSKEQHKQDAFNHLWLSYDGNSEEERATITELVVPYQVKNHKA